MFGDLLSVVGQDSVVEQWFHSPYHGMLPVTQGLPLGPFFS